MVQVAEVCAWRAHGRDAEARGKPAGGLLEERLAAIADQHLDGHLDTGQGLVVGQEAVESSSLDLQVGVGARQDSAAQIRIKTAPVRVPRDETVEPLDPARRSL